MVVWYMEKNNYIKVKENKQGKSKVGHKACYMVKEKEHS